MLLQFKELADEVLFCEAERLQLTEDLLKYLHARKKTQNTIFVSQYRKLHHLFISIIKSTNNATLSNLVLSATSRSEADMLPMSSSEEDWERRLFEVCTVSLLRLEVDPVSFPELP